MSDKNSRDSKTGANNTVEDKNEIEFSDEGGTPNCPERSRLGVAMNSYLAEQAHQPCVEIPEHVEEELEEVGFPLLSLSWWGTAIFTPSVQRWLSLQLAGILFGVLLWTWVASLFQVFDTGLVALGMVLSWWGVSTWTKHDSKRPSLREVLPKAGQMVLRGIFGMTGFLAFGSLFCSGWFVCSLPFLYVSLKNFQLAALVPPLHRLKQKPIEPAGPKMLPAGSAANDKKT